MTSQQYNFTVSDKVGIDFPAKCYRCEFEPLTKKQYNEHCIQEHKGLAGYPNRASIRKFKLECQGCWWEA